MDVNTKREPMGGKQQKVNPIKRKTRNKALKSKASNCLCLLRLH